MLLNLVGFIRLGYAEVQRAIMGFQLCKASADVEKSDINQALSFTSLIGPLKMKSPLEAMQRRVNEQECCEFSNITSRCVTIIS